MKFTFTKTPIPGLLVVQPEVGQDERGTFSENYKASEFRKAGIKALFVQENRSVSRRNVLRGLHFQRQPHAQAKLVRCARGRIFEVAVDLRPRSRTYGRSFAIELSGKSGKMLYLPEGFAHGFYALTREAEVMYKCSREYAPSHDAGVRWNDPDLKIKWPCRHPRISVKDASLPFLKELRGGK